MASYPEAATLTAAVNGRLTNVEGRRLIPPELVEMWTEHSERATLPTILDGFGLDPRDRNAFGRWRPGSDIYSRSFSGKIRRIHRYFTAEIEKLRLAGNVDDYDVLEAAFAWLRSRRGFSAEDPIEQESENEGEAEAGEAPSEEPVERAAGYVLEYLEKKLQEVEHGEFKAESPQEVTTRDELDPDTLVPVWDSKGVMTVKRGSSRVALSSNPEELRRRLNIMINAYLMLKLEFPGRSDLQDLEADLFERYKEYLLGDYVHNLQARDSADSVVHTPPWQLVLSYEQAVRKQAFHYMVTDSIAMGAAWEKAWKDPVTKERHFSTPLSLYAKRNSGSPPTRDLDYTTSRQGSEGQQGKPWDVSHL
ncbi:unnamed protein product [Symbiodinium necroappetens]|uniref:Uncharacterized protein n=1 Tax=Symbiodinium necroappetens TaxID=1628268 RepID=A0A813AC91_9DINO|nr:unnamed protein product [Symbiodinium necroappetens]